MPDMSETLLYVTDVAKEIERSIWSVRLYVKRGWIKPAQFDGVKMQFRPQDVQGLRKYLQKHARDENERRKLHMKARKANGN